MKLPTGLLLALAACSAPALAAAPADDWSGCEAALRRIAEPSFPARAFPVTRFGAVGDGRTDNRAAIARAVEACAAAGGGRVEVPPGVFFCDGPVVLRSGVDLDVAAGATLRFGADPERYFPLVLSRYEGTMCYSQCPRIYARGCSGVAVTGGGVIDANGKAGMAAIRERKGMVNPAELRRLAVQGVPAENRVFGRDRWLRASAVEFVDCAGVLVRGVTVVDSEFWVVHPVLCRDVVVRGIKVNSTSANNDGCDPDSCADVLIENCDFHTGDDAIAIKSGRDSDGWAVGRPCENVVVRGCLMRARWGGVCIGSEMSGGVRHVWVENCRVAAASSALYFKGNLDRGGVVEDVHVRRISADEVRAAAVRFETGYHGYGGGKHPPTFRDFTIEDVQCARSAAYGVAIEGAPDLPVSGLRLRRISVEAAAQPLWLRGARDVSFEQVRVGGVELPAAPPATAPETAKLGIDS